MQLTKLRAAPVLRAEVPPCAPAGRTDGGTASQLIRSVRQTQCEGGGPAPRGVESFARMENVTMREATVRCAGRRLPLLSAALLMLLFCGRSTEGADSAADEALCRRLWRAG